jgi:hypothetical protein
VGLLAAERPGAEAGFSLYLHGQKAVGAKACLRALAPDAACEFL